MTLAETIGTNLRRVMDGRRLNAPELADRVGVTKVTVYNWLEGKGMTLDNLEACARELRVQPATLCRRTGRDRTSKAV